MKSQKGITLISVTIYVVVLAIVIGIMSVVSTYFFKNINNIENIDPLTQYTKFNSYFSEETNTQNIKVLDCKIEESGNSYIVFDNGVQYSFIKNNKGIYRNRAKICRNIDNCTFSSIIKNGKNVIVVEFESGDKKESMNFTLSM